MFKFKKIASVLASTAMVSSTVALAAAANYPMPFVDNGTPNVAIVYGSNQVGGTDLAAASNIITDLSAEVVTSGTSGTTSTVTGESFQISVSNDEFNLGDNATMFYSTIDEDHLSTILAPGVYNNDDNDEYDYTQGIVLTDVAMTHFQDDDFNDEKPAIGFEFPDGTHILNYTLDFKPDNAEGGADWVDFEGTSIELLGKEYYILSASNATGTESLTLLDSANTVLLAEGDTQTVDVGGTSYDVSINFISSNSVKLNINGEVTPALNEDDTRKLATGDYVGIREILVQDYAGGQKQVEFSIGTGKIELVNGDEVQINGEDISDLYDDVVTSYVVPNGAKLDKIVLDWETGEDTWLAFGTDSTEMTMPAFGSLKLNLGNFVVDAEEMTTVTYDSSDKFKLETTVSDGDVSFDFLYTNSSKTGFLGLGKDATHKLVTNSSSSPTIAFNTDTDSYFVATWYNGDDHESYVLDVTKIDDADADNATTIKSIASGSDVEIVLDVDTDTSEDIGDRITVTLVSASEDSNTAVFTLTPRSGGTVYADRIVTAEGLKIQLPVDTVTTGDGYLNLTGAQSNTTDAVYDPTSFVMNFTEEDQDGNINAGASFTTTLAMPSAETSVGEPDVTNYEVTDGSDDYEGYVVSDLATMILFKDDDQDSLDITYHGTEAYGEVFVSESGATVGSSDNGPIGPAMKDSEVTASLNKNLIVVGGSCVNTVAAELLGSSTALCGPDFTAATGVGAGSYLIETFDRADKVATLVAGYNAGDTTNAATALTTQDIDTTVGKKYTGTTATSVEAVAMTA